MFRQEISLWTPRKNTLILLRKSLQDECHEVTPSTFGVTSSECGAHSADRNCLKVELGSHLDGTFVSYLVDGKKHSFCIGYEHIYLPGRRQ